MTHRETVQKNVEAQTRSALAFAADLYEKRHGFRPAITESFVELITLLGTEAFLAGLDPSTTADRVGEVIITIFNFQRNNAVLWAAMALVKSPDFEHMLRVGLTGQEEVQA